MFSLILISCLFTLSYGISRQFYFVNETKTWNDAQNYCRRMYTDLATIQDVHDQAQVINIIPAGYNQVWIGLYGDINSWNWYLNDDAFYVPYGLNYRNWAFGEPNNYGGKEYCTELYSNGYWNDLPCDWLLPFVCYIRTDNTTILIEMAMNASDARQYCQEHYTDLASIRNSVENEQTLVKTEGQDVWIGLYRTFLWSDQSNYNYQNWDNEEPDFPSNAHCTLLESTGKWKDDDCNINKPFVCYKTTPTTTFMTSTATPTTPFMTSAVTTPSSSPVTTPSSNPATPSTPLMTSTATPPTQLMTSTDTTPSSSPANVIGIQINMTSSRELVHSEMENLIQQLFQQLSQEDIKIFIRNVKQIT